MYLRIFQRVSNFPWLAEILLLAGKSGDLRGKPLPTPHRLRPSSPVHDDIWEQNIYSYRFPMLATRNINWFSIFNALRWSPLNIHSHWSIPNSRIGKYKLVFNFISYTIISSKFLWKLALKKLRYYARKIIFQIKIKRSLNQWHSNAHVVIVN